MKYEEFLLKMVDVFGWRVTAQYLQNRIDQDAGAFAGEYSAYRYIWEGFEWVCSNEGRKYWEELAEQIESWDLPDLQHGDIYQGKHCPWILTKGQDDMWLLTEIRIGRQEGFGGGVISHGEQTMKQILRDNWTKVIIKSIKAEPIV